MKEAGLIIFIKNPILGKVKTRLAASIGDEAALGVYNKLSEHTRAVASQVEATRFLYYDSEINFQDDWSQNLFEKKIQVTGDLGSRMSDAFETCLERCNKVLIIGSDCPELSLAFIESAFRKLEFADVVIGPTLDGGYYLLGMKAHHDFLFADMTWSTDTVFSETENRIKKNGLLYALCPTLSDLDNIDDLNKFPNFAV